MSFLNRINNEKLASLSLVKGYDQNDAPIYAFIVGRKSDLEKAIDISQRLIVDLSEKATILFKGTGHTVPDDVHQNALLEFNRLVSQ